MTSRRDILDVLKECLLPHEDVRAAYVVRRCMDEYSFAYTESDNGIRQLIERLKPAIGALLDAGFELVRLGCNRFSFAVRDYRVFILIFHDLDTALIVVCDKWVNVPETESALTKPTDMIFDLLQDGAWEKERREAY